MARAKVNYKDLEKFAERLKGLNDEQINQFNEAAVKELAARLLRKVIFRTPVGKRPTLAQLGGEKKSFKVKSVNGKSKSFLTREGAILAQYWSGYKGGTLRRGWTVGEVTKSGNAYSVEVINPTKYASYVEFGHRQRPGRYVPAIGKTLKSGWVEGRFMLTISEQELEADAPRILENKLKRLFKDVFK